jgi:hypothetical protein
MDRTLRNEYFISGVIFLFIITIVYVSVETFIFRKSINKKFKHLKAKHRNIEASLMEGEKMNKEDNWKSDENS